MYKRDTNLGNATVILLSLDRPIRSLTRRQTNYLLALFAVSGLTCIQVQHSLHTVEISYTLQLQYNVAMVIYMYHTSWLAHAQFSNLATLDTGYVTHVTLGTRLPLVFQCATLKNWEEPGDRARHEVWYM